MRVLFNGEILDNSYQIINKIGSGGTGDVYLAYHLRLEKYVVIKKIKDQFVDLVNVRAEVDILKRLKHTYLPQVYDFVQYGNQVYTVMDYIEGCSLDDYIRQGELLDEATILKWLSQLCEVLDYLHSQEPPIIHSDIKPMNIMVTTQGDICLIDFNISLDGDDSSQISGISLPYASPEQYTKAVLFKNGQYHSHIVLDGRSDMYSLAASFYYLMTMTPPSNPDTMSIPLIQWDLPYNDNLLEIIDKAMMPEPEYRYNSMDEMLKAVKSVYRRTKEYKRYYFGVLFSSIIYLLTMSLGIYFIVYGTNMKKSESYNIDEKKMISYYQSGNYDDALNVAYDILNNQAYKQILSDNKKEKIELFHMMGESYFYLEDYANACSNYELAVSYIEDVNDYTDYYRDYIVSLVRFGSIDTALSLMDELKKSGITDKDIELVNAELAVYNKNYEAALEKIDRMLSRNIDEKTRLHLLVLGSDVSNTIKNYSKQISYLQEAKKMGNTTSILRKLGNAYMDAAYQVKSNDNSSKGYYKKALDCYSELESNSYSSFNDKLNLSICYRALERYSDSIKVLKQMEKDNDDYRVYMNLAFTYERQNDVENCVKYVSKCLRKYESTAEAEKESEGSDNIQNIKELEKKYR